MATLDSKRAGHRGNRPVSSMSNPNLCEIVLSVGIALQALMQRCEASVGLTLDDPMAIFDERVYSTQLWVDDQGQLPIERVVDYVGKCLTRADFSCEVLITALCLFARFERQVTYAATKTRMVTASNWRLLFLTSLLVAQKIWDDSSLDNACFVLVWRFAAPSNEEEPEGWHINQMERVFLNLMRFDVYVSPRVYAEYYFELRSVYLNRFGPDSCFPLVSSSSQRCFANHLERHL
jgi:hypothetical protein